MLDTDFETVTCRLCGSATYGRVLSGPDYFLRKPGAFTLVRCGACGLLFQNPRPTLDTVGRYYPDDYGSYVSATTGLRGRRGLLGAIVRRGMAKRCRLLDQAVSPAGERPRCLLDAGCASGLFLEAMQQYPGWQVEGAELNERAAHATAARLGIPVFAGPLEAAHYADATFDAVTLWDVLEHFHDPLAMLREIQRILRPGGALFVRVPNGASALRRWCGRYWVGYDLPRHMTLFTPATLEAMFAQAGFAPPLQRYTSGSYLSTLHSLRFALDSGVVSPARAAAIHRALYHPVGRALAWLPFRIVDWAERGSALEVLVRKCEQS